ncbi:MAG: AMP phosphorylase [Hadesarchaea archaeon]|nr:AMP phosphorylase [Hadesarchaea archaeon]
MKKLTLKAKPLDMETGRNIVVIHEMDSQEIGHFPGDRVRLITEKKTIVAIANETNKLVKPGELGAFREVTEALSLKSGDLVNVEIAPRPQSVVSIKKKMMGGKLTYEEIGTIIRDVVDGNLSTTEMTAFVVSEFIRGMDLDEIVALTQHMLNTGDRIDFDREHVVDVHSIGGVPGNKYALITVPIVAASGIIVPKTSSRAITSAAGTADVMEVLANVALSIDEIKKIASKVGGVLAWGGAVNLAPADDIIISTERQLGIDPRCQLLASVMSKKLAEGVDSILIDIPTGPGAKVESIEEARSFAHDFIELGHKLGVQVEVAVTYGGQPVGHNVGPALEAKEALETLLGKGPSSLVEKATSLAAIMLELGGAAAAGLGKEMALEILRSGKAYQKMREIIAAQGGDPDIKPEDIPIGDKKEVVVAPYSGYVTQIYNQNVNEIARAAGAPRDKGAGVVLLRKKEGKVDKGEPLFEIYAEHESKLEEALEIARRKFPFKIEGMLLEKITHRPRVV